MSPEPPANIMTLVDLYRYTGDATWLRPIPAALAWLDAAELTPAQMKAVYGEDAPEDYTGGLWAQSYAIYRRPGDPVNRPIFGTYPAQYTATFDYWESGSSSGQRQGYGTYSVASAAWYYDVVRDRTVPGDRWKEGNVRSSRAGTWSQARAIIADLDDQGRWLTGGDVVRIGSFVSNVRTLTFFLARSTHDPR